jgi:small conductance mechanosensitive channel
VILYNFGLTGIALGFALKDMILNFSDGVLLRLNHLFSAGDRIKVLNYEGIFVSIDFRYTEFEDKGDRIMIPNSKLLTDPIFVF